MANASAKLKAKDLSLIVANDITAPGAGFGVDTNRVTLIGAGRVRAGAAGDEQSRGGRGRDRPGGAAALQRGCNGARNVSQPGSLHLGTQGFAFDDWVGPFYPPGTAKSAYLEAYAQAFSTVEIDSTFYAIPRSSVVEGWARRTPNGFRFAAKFPKLITHDKKLEGARGDAEAFVGTMQALGDKLGVLTLQFAYDFTPDLFGRLEAFLRDLPQGPRYAVEIRNRQWLTADLGEMLSGLGVALVLQDLYYMPKMSWITTDFTVIRWLGRRSDIERFDRHPDRPDEGAHDLGGARAPVPG